MELLQKMSCWVCMHFKDGTVKCIHTTLNTDILAKYGASPREEHFFDLEHGVFVPFRRDAVEITVSEEKPKFEQEVLQFASRFI